LSSFELVLSCGTVEFVSEQQVNESVRARDNELSMCIVRCSKFLFIHWFVNLRFGCCYSMRRYWAKGPSRQCKFRLFIWNVFIGLSCCQFETSFAIDACMYGIERSHDFLQMPVFLAFCWFSQEFMRLPVFGSIMFFIGHRVACCGLLQLTFSPPLQSWREHPMLWILIVSSNGRFVAAGLEGYINYDICSLWSLSRWAKNAVLSICSAVWFSKQLPGIWRGWGYRGSLEPGESTRCSAEPWGLGAALLWGAPVEDSKTQEHHQAV